MPTDVYIYCPSGEEGAIRGDLEYDLEDFFGAAARFSGGGGVPGFNLDFELADGEDVEAWVVRLRDFLIQANARPSTFFEVFPDGWEPGQAEPNAAADRAGILVFHGSRSRSRPGC